MWYRLIWFICFFPVINGFGQSLTKKEMDSAVSVMAGLIDKYYVFEKKGKLIAHHLLQQHKKGEFLRVNSWKEFASKTTKVLQDFSKDGHLYVEQDKEAVASLLGRKPGYANDSITSEIRSRESNYGYKEVKILDGNIGYVKMTKIDVTEKSIPVLFAAMQFIANTKALIIDLQDNGGGGGDTGPVFESIFLPGNTPLLEFKSRDGSSTIDKTLEWLPIKYNRPLYILVNEKTASAAEYLAFVLRLRNRAKVLGQKSAGGANMNTWYPVNNQIYISVSTAAPTIPGTEETWEGKGVPLDYPLEKGKELQFVRSLEMERQ